HRPVGQRQRAVGPRATSARAGADARQSRPAPSRDRRRSDWPGRIARTAYEHLGDRRGIASVLTNQGNIEWQSGNLTAAFTTHEEARVLYQQAGDTRGMAWSDTNTGRIAAEQGHFHEAVPRLNAALDIYVAVGDISGVAEIMEAIALVTLELGDADRSSMLAGAATALRDSINSSRNSPDLEAFQAVLDALESRADHDHATAFAQGRSMSLEDALTLVRSVETPPAPEAPDAPDHQRLARAEFGITDREHEVLLLICDGLADGEIAERLGIGLRTVHTHVHQLVVKLDAASRVAVIRSAHQAKIVPAR
ncbi:MAG: LuxR family transcriptional regulator, partial [Chloroflexia bacterium]|nr:LuxR family transcriptional regulator [Chloroflexia bacterium]